MLLVTGASGYVGRAVLPELAQHGHTVRATTRALSALYDESAVFYDMSNEAPLSAALFEGVSSIVHCAGIAHRQATTTDYKRLNVTATVRLAQAAAAAGVSQFVFVSSMNIVPTNSSAPDAEAADWPEPRDPYSASKWLAEQELVRVLRGTTCDLTIVRPGLVYDQELTANLARLQGLLGQYPVGLPAVGCRTMVGRSDLARLLALIASGRCGALAGQPVLIASDGECYDAARISRSLSPGGLRLALPGSVWRLASLVIDLWSGRPAGATWGSLSHRFWCGPVPKAEAWETTYVKWFPKLRHRKPHISHGFL